MTGDWNYRRRPRRRFPKFVLHQLSPQKNFERCRLAYVEHGLDYVAYPQEMVRKNIKIIDKDKHGGDHDWVIVEVE